jgi:hypothetical protein
MSNLDLQRIFPKVTDQSWSIHKYSGLTPNMELPYWTMLLYQYPGQIGHWTLVKCEPGVIYFFDPYDKPPDYQ